MAAPDRPPAQTPRPRPTLLEAVADLPIALRVALVAATLVVGTFLVAVLEQSFGVADASPLYLIPVVLAAAFLGTWAAVATSLTAFVIYDYLFTTPRFTFTVSDPAEWLNLLLFLVVAVVLGRLAALLRDRAEEADRRAREAEALVAISRDIAVATSFDEAAVAVAARLRRDAEMESVWITLADRPGEAIAASGAEGDAEDDAPWTLVRSTPDGGSDWLRLRGEATGAHPATTSTSPSAGSRRRGLPATRCRAGERGGC